MILLKEYTDFNDVKVINESMDKDLFIEGIFAQSEVKNRNGRIYPKQVMDGAVTKYIKEYVEKRRALGELSHPENRPQVKPELASHLITELHIDDKTVYGKARILETPQGQIVRGLLRGGVQLGVSTRGLGTVTERAGSNYVGNDFALMTVDIVTDPSAPDAFVQSVNENCEWLITDDGRIVEAVKQKIKRTKLDEAATIALFQEFMQSIK